MIFNISTTIPKNIFRSRFLTVLIFISIGAKALLAQPTSGHLQGKIIDKATGEALQGASVYVQGSSIGSMTDIEGSYRIANIPFGKHNLIVSYIGYKTNTVAIEINSAKTQTLDVKLDATIIEGKEVVITGQLQGQAQAINRQVASDQIVNIVSEQKIKELPDANAAESVGRLPGVAVQRDGGEASKLMIRGLDPKFTNITLNGIQIPATSADSRDVDLSLISQSSLSGIELYKALTPDQDADAIAGVVNLVTGQAKAGQNITMDIFGIYSGMSESAKQYKFSGSYSNRFFDNFLGVQAGFNSEKRDRNREAFTDDWTIPANGDYQISALTVEYDQETRKRYGGNINLDINTPDGGTIKMTNLYSKTTRKIFSSTRDYPENGSVTYSANSVDKDIYTINNSLTGENFVDALKINWALSRAYTKNEKPFDHFMRFYENTTTTSGMRTITDPSVLKLSGKNLIQYAYNNFSMANVDRAYFRWDNNDERNYDIKTDLEYPIRISDDLSGMAKAGYKFRTKSRERECGEKMTAYWLRTSFNYYYDDNGNVAAKDWANSDWPSGYHGLLTDFLKGSSYPTRTIDGQYLLNPVIDDALIRNWYAFNKNGTDKTGTNKEYFENLIGARNTYKVEENVHGTYAMVKLNAGQLITLIAGARYEYENNKYTAKYAPRILGEFESQSEVVFDTTSKYKKEFWLPNFHIKVKPLEWLDFRFALSKSISRPDYSMRLPVLYINNESQEITSGNPNLEPAVSWNYDASMELYSNEYGLLTISGFRKNIDNIFYWLNDIVIMSDAQARSYGLPVDKYGPFNQYKLDMPVNTSGTKVWGFELDMQTHLGFLPGLLSNIVMSANYSRIWSKTKYPRFTLVQSSDFPPKTPTPLYYESEKELSGQTDYTGNIAVGYDYKGFSGRVSVYFQGPYLVSISNIEREDVYQKAFSRIDLSLKQAVSEAVSAFVNINNLTNTIEGSYNSFLELDRGGYLYGITAELGVQLSL
jgi:TonB-dependent receptor